MQTETFSGGVLVWDHYCREHRQRELDDGATAYLVCGECSHAYPTPQDLENEYRRATGRDSSRAHVYAHDIEFCPVCISLLPGAPRTQLPFNPWSGPG